jgi:serine/threonine protein kinase
MASYGLNWVILDLLGNGRGGDCKSSLVDYADDRMETYCGTTGYASPEMLAGRKYLGVETDIWSLGIILYTLLAGGLPFDDDDERVMKDLILKGEYEEPEWLTEGESNVSWNATDDRRPFPHPKHAPSRPHSTPLNRIDPYPSMVQINNS